MNEDPGIRLEERDGEVFLHFTVNELQLQALTPLVTTELLGRAKIPDLPFVQRDGTPYRIDTDYLGEKRNTTTPFPGPFERPKGGKLRLKVWP